MSELVMCVCVYTHRHVCRHVYTIMYVGVRGKLHGVSSLLLLCWSQGLNQAEQEKLHKTLTPGRASLLEINKLFLVISVLALPVSVNKQTGLRGSLR